MLITFLLYIVCVNAGDTKPKDPVNSQLGWFPYVVSVRVDNQHVCGGAILDSTHVLTAAHCLTEHVNNPGSVEVVTSAVLLDQGGELHRASRFVVPPAYPKVDELDIAVIKLQDPIVENQYQHRIALSQVKPPTNTYALLVGWGEIPNSKPPRLTNAQQYVYIWIIDTDKCNAYYQREHGQHICTSTRSNYGVCPGDSGSPLVLNDQVIGVTSRGFCEKGRPDLFVRVYDNLAFIYNALKS